MMTMTMLASRTVPRSRPLQVRTAASSVLACSSTSTSTSSVPFCRPIQIRTFRFGLWSSCLDPIYHRELRRRHRDLKHKYLDSLNQRLSWHDLEHPLAREPRLALKRAVARFWIPTAAQYTSRWLSQDEFASPKPATPRPPFSSWHQHLDHIINPRSRQTPPDMNSQCDKEMRAEYPSKNSTTRKPKSQDAVQSECSSTAEQGYVIDPITNRKVPKRGPWHTETGPENPTRSFKNYRTQFVPFAPQDVGTSRSVFYSNGKPPASELDKYAESKFDDWPKADTLYPSDAAELSAHTESSSYIFDSSKLKAEEYSLNHLPLEDPSEEYGDSQEQECQPAVPDDSLEKSLDSSKDHDVVDRVTPQSRSHIDLSHQPISEPDQVQKELRDYGPYMHDEDSATHTDSQDLKDLEQYRYRAPKEPESSTEPLTVYDDLHKYEPATFDDFKDQDKPFGQYGDLEKYKAFRLQHLDTTAATERDSVTESLKEYEDKEQDDRIPDVFDTSVHHLTFQEKPDQNVANDVTPSFLQHFQQIKNTHESGFKPEDSESSALNKPHDQEVQGIVQNTEEKYPETLFSVTNNEVLQPTPDQPSNSPRLESALGRYISAMDGNRDIEVDLFSKEPQGLETSFVQECGGKHTMPLYRRIYGREPCQAPSKCEPASGNKAPEPPERSSDLYYERDPEIDGIPPSESVDPAKDQKTTQPEEPTVYKILAYDPTMQTINVAETSSVVPDVASPLSPTEVLLRLSNPTKFFPHFASLQAEGFEIVSGSGDVLVFRQVRPAKPAIQGGVTHVNPIDMMGRSTAVPNAAAFVSPTGFVNYDVPRVEEELAERAHRLGRSVRREEVVFSGQKPRSGHKEGNEDKKPRMNVGNRVIIGGVWVASLSYALGVVSEYFATGGTDGKGPTGFSPV
ncbi:hypothetical protein F4825DRAFT_438025 [Nemania diffusa]|nr:hypothetical protein F4825DRAFT_438025 [Nemania diffusa]